MQSKINIIGGTWRSRKIQFDEVEGLRPTPARIRETLFNWLQYDIFGSRCLDLYAGSGALGIEAASRGAAFVLQIEYNALACRHLKTNAALLKAEQINIVQAEVLNFLTTEPQTFDLVFLDPPFHSGLAARTCQLLETQHWLASPAKIYVETELKDVNKKPFLLQDLPENWRLLKQKSAGEVQYHLFERH